MTVKISNKEVILGYLNCLDNLDYNGAKKYLDDNVKVVGPSGEVFANSNTFLEMLSKNKGKYDIKKIFVDKNDVGVFYYFSNSSAKVFMASWYEIEKSKIRTIQTIFDSKMLPMEPKT